MRCPRCHLGDQSAVVNIRHRSDGSIRRRHHCERCRLRWTALETIVLGSLCGQESVNAARAGRTPGEGLK